MNVDHTGPHLLIGGTHDGERRAVNALTTEVLRLVPRGPWTGHPAPPRETPFYEHYHRHLLNAWSHIFFVYALDMTDAEVARALVERYRKTDVAEHTPAAADAESPARGEAGRGDGLTLET